jgi:hypothetical protein
MMWIPGIICGLLAVIAMLLYDIRRQMEYQNRLLRLACIRYHHQP